jgi:ABC-2 type transport system permease protein
LRPIVVLLPATAAFGDELEDGTLPYLLMKPVSRLRLVLGKYAAVLVVTIPALLLGMAVTTLIASRAPEGDDLRQLFIAMAGSAAMAAVLLGSVFLLVSLVVPRALLAGMLYIFAWESLLGRFLPGIRAISSREYTMRVFDGLLVEDTTAAWNAALTMIVVAAVALGLAVLRLRQMEVD